MDYGSDFVDPQWSTVVDESMPAYGSEPCNFFTMGRAVFEFLSDGSTNRTPFPRIGGTVRCMDPPPIRPACRQGIVPRVGMSKAGKGKGHVRVLTHPSCHTA